jgi:purine-nucleoside phosphorylase
MNKLLNELKQTTTFLQKNGISKPEVGIILGTGLNQLIKEVTLRTEIDYSDIPNFPVSTVECHSGKLIYGELAGKKVLVMQGRFHYYEGYSLYEVTFPVRIMKKLGIKYLLISNAAGAMNLNFKKATLMLIEDHINMLPDNPLRGLNDPEFGLRFPDMSEPYDLIMNNKIVEIAKRESIKLDKGIYLAVSGPNLETKAEYRFFSKFADAVGMSTVPEVIVANQIGLMCAAISVLTDECDPDNLKKVSVEEIIAAAAKAEPDLIKLLTNLIGDL